MYCLTFIHQGIKKREMNLKQCGTNELTTLVEKVDRLKKEHINLIQARTEKYRVSKKTQNTHTEKG